jgi:hypothetical protein
VGAGNSIDKASASPRSSALDDRAGVVGDQLAQHWIDVLYVAEVVGTIKRMKARGGEFGRVADVVEPSSSFEQVGVVTEDRSERVGLRSDTLDVGPATRKRDFEEFACQFSGPVSLVHAY